jgi:hypothetical protein
MTLGPGRAWTPKTLRNTRRTFPMHSHPSESHFCRSNLRNFRAPEIQWRPPPGKHRAQRGKRPLFTAKYSNDDAIGQRPTAPRLVALAIARGADFWARFQAVVPLSRHKVRRQFEFPSTTLACWFRGFRGRGPWRHRLRRKRLSELRRAIGKFEWRGKRLHGASVERLWRRSFGRNGEQRLERRKHGRLRFRARNVGFVERLSRQRRVGRRRGRGLHELR